jgi:hypothetical protein
MGFFHEKKENNYPTFKNEKYYPEIEQRKYKVSKIII